jgi:hypothetical protein
MLKTLALASLLLSFVTTARAADLAFVGRTQSIADIPNTSIALATPAGMQDCDVMLVFIASYNSAPTAPSGWISLGSLGNANYDVGAAFMKVWHTGNPTSYTFGNVNWPKAVMRVYRGVTGVDSANFAASGGGVSSLTLPALTATTAANDAYIAFFVSDNYASAITGPADLADQAADQTQWASFDGDKIILNQGTEPPAEAAVLSSGAGNWVGFMITLAHNPANLTFVGRTQSTAGIPNTSITLATPAGIHNNDVMLAFIASWNSAPTTPSGWTSLGSLGNANYGVGAAFVKTWHTGDPTSYTFGNVNWPKAVMRVYRGMTGVDSSQFAASGGGAPSLTLPALSATTAANDAYIAFFVSDNYTRTIIGPPDLADQTVDQIQWASFDGDKLVMSRGAIPPSESASLSAGTGNWVGFAVTLGNNPSPPRLPYGNVPPPAGQSWYVTLDDEFSQDSVIDTTKWNGGPGGPPGSPFPMCQSDNNDALGNSGGSCNQFFGNTATLTAPYDAISPGVGLLIQPLTNYMDPDASLKDTSQDWMALQSYGKFTQKFGYFEISAKMPHDNGSTDVCGTVQYGNNEYGTGTGDGDGLHPDIWLTVPGRTALGGGDEVDIAENDLGPNTTTNVHFSVFDGGNEVVSIGYPSTSMGDLSADFHRYAVYWRNDGTGAYGSFQAYFDGQPVNATPAPVSDPGFNAGVYILPGWMQQLSVAPLFGGCMPSASTSNNNPLIIRYVRVWQSR